MFLSSDFLLLSSCIFAHYCSKIKPLFLFVLLRVVFLEPHKLLTNVILKVRFFLMHNKITIYKKQALFIADKYTSTRNFVVATSGNGAVWPFCAPSPENCPLALACTVDTTVCLRQPLQLPPGPSPPVQAKKTRQEKYRSKMNAKKIKEDTARKKAQSQRD